METPPTTVEMPTLGSLQPDGDMPTPSTTNRSIESSATFQSWLRAQDLNKQPKLGFSFCGLSCHGFLSSSRSQATVTSYLLTAPRLLINTILGRNRNLTKVQILTDFTGSVRNGEMLLVLGRPGSGCSTFLKTLAGDTHGFHIGDKSSINYQGVSYDRMHTKFKGECLYLAELDVHFPELTLGQTFDIAARMRNVTEDATTQDISRNVASLFSLDGALGTKMGNSTIRGISGGERRRASLAEAFISGAPVQCWDNSTRGLDSSTSLGFIALLRASTTALQSAVAMSIYQASDAMFENFDKVTLLYEGRQIYLGPARDAVSYFTGLGFSRPARTTIADFLTSLTNPSERIPREGYEHKVPKTPDEFASLWRESTLGKAIASEVATFDAFHEKSEAPELGGRTYSLGINEQIAVCVRRGFLRLKNNYIPVVAGAIANAILAIVTGSVFYNLDQSSNSMDRRSILIFFSLMVTGFAPAFEVLTMWAQRPIVEKHSRYGFYHPFAEGLASIICDLPNKIASSTMFNVTLYFMTNLRRTADGFWIFYLFSFVVLVTMSMVFRTIGSLSKTMSQTMAPGSIMVLVFIATTGFVIPHDYLVPWLGWLRWLNPIAYAYESLMINEFNGRDFPCSLAIPVGPSYPQDSMVGRTCATVGAVPGESMVEGSAYLATKYGYTQPHHLWRNLPIILAMMRFFAVVHLLASEYIPIERSRGEILLFKRGHSSRVVESIGDDTESQSPVKFTQESHAVELEKDHRKNEVSRAQAQIPKQTNIFHWAGVQYEINMGNNCTKTILKDINGWVKPGTLTALMGVTGAGKTSLLDVLAGRVSVGTVSGDIYVNNRVRDASFQRRMGYAQQEDIHLSTSTVREALTFSALLRQPNHTPKHEKLAYVDTVLDMLDMVTYADAVVGVPGEGLNVEQRKRLTIAVEMVAKPDLLLFLDEPTSGLDSQTAWSVCMLLRKLADNGQAILCTIHQPSSQLFAMFDRLLLLSRGGETLYFGDVGPEAATLVKYFENNGAVHNCPLDANPVEWILDVTAQLPKTNTTSELDPQAKAEERDSSGRTGEPHEVWAQRWNDSHEKAAVLEQLAPLHVNTGKGGDITTTSEDDWNAHDEYATSWYTQMALVSQRIFQEYWRDPVYISAKMSLCAGLSLANGLNFLNTPLTLQGLTNLLFSIFLICQLFSTLDQQVIPRLVDNRALFEARERRSKAYSWTVFLAANILVEAAWQVAASLLVYVTWYYPTGLWHHPALDPESASSTPSQKGFLVYLLVWLFCLWVTTFSQMVAVAIEHAETAVQIATLCFWLSTVFCGIIVSPFDLPRFWHFVYRVSPLTYFMNGVAIAGLADTKLTCSATESIPIRMAASSPSVAGANGTLTCGEYLGLFAQIAAGYVVNPDTVDETCLYCPVSDTNLVLGGRLGLGTEMREAWRNVGILAAYVVFNAAVTFALYWTFRVPKRWRSGRK